MGKNSKRKVGKNRKRHPRYRSLDALAAEILEDGRIDDDEIRTIRTRIYADGVIDQEEAEFLFKLNDETNDNTEAWQPLFVKAIASFLLEDDTSPGEIDEAEARWLVERIQSDGQIDDNEAALLNHLKQHATSIHPVLQEFEGF